MNKTADAVLKKAIADREAAPCNMCGNVQHTVEVDHEPLCDRCGLRVLIDIVERLSTMYVTCNAEVRYDYE